MLRENNIEFKQNKRILDLQTSNGGYPLFDFQLFKDGVLIAAIEMQGIQHYEENPMPEFGRYEREVTDPLKKEYCKSHNIPLFEIRYDEDPTAKAIEIIEALYANTVPRLQ